MPTQPRLLLNDGHTIPQIGLGVWQTPPEETAPAAEKALQVGYRHLDTAAIYGNESGIGEGIRRSGVERSEIFVTTKLWNDNQGYDAALKAFDESLGKLGLEYVDLYLIHWPAPSRNLYVDSWRALVRLREEGRVRSIGVSNFAEDHLARIVEATGVVPVLNQIELHPDFQQKALRAYHQKLGIATQSWSPLGQGKLLENADIKAMAGRLGRTPAQVIIRWHLENGLVVIPKSVTPARIEENFNVFDFHLDKADLELLAKLDSATSRLGPDPLTATF